MVPHGHAEQTLRRFRPALLLEVSTAHLARHDDSVADLTAFLHRLGYRPAAGWCETGEGDDVVYVAG